MRLMGLRLLPPAPSGVCRTSVVRVHRHVDAGIDGELDGFLLILGYVVAAIKVVDVRPVSHNHTVPVEVFFSHLVSSS